MATSQGVALKKDGVGPQRIYHQQTDDRYPDEILNFWLKAEKTQFHVGGEQRETFAEKLEAENCGKASSKIIGTVRTEFMFFQFSLANIFFFNDML